MTTTEVSRVEQGGIKPRFSKWQKITTLEPGGPSEPWTYIYLLIDPLTKRTRYVGTTNAPGRRLSQHYEKGSRRVREWVASLPVHPVMLIVEILPTRTQHKGYERRWLNRCKQDGADLLNVFPRYTGKRRRGNG